MSNDNIDNSPTIHDSELPKLKTEPYRIDKAKISVCEIFAVMTQPI